jgi:hypothetical protein
MDHSGMDHGGHGGGMPMDMCSMSVCLASMFEPYLSYPSKLYSNTSMADALHVEHQEPLLDLQMVAHPLNPRSYLLPPRDRRPHSSLRSAPFPIPKIRKSCG